jgi:hypothetical protein
MNTKPSSLTIIHVVATLAATVAIGCSGHDTNIGDGTSSSGSSGASGAPSSSGGTNPPGSGAAALYDAPSGSATPDSIFGVWGGSKTDNGITFDARMKLTKDSATLATRCTVDSTRKVSGIVGITVAARVTDESYVILESKSDEVNEGGVRCSVNLAPREVKRCKAEDKGFEHDCFTVEGTTFTAYGASSFDAIALTKLSD